MKATVLVSQNIEKIIAIKERLYAELENGDIEEWNFEQKMSEIEPEEYVCEEFWFRASDIKRWSTHEDRIQIEFKDGAVSLLKKEKEVLTKLRTELAL